MSYPNPLYPSMPMPPPRQLRISEKLLTQIRAAAATGVSPDRIAPALGLTPEEFRGLWAKSHEIERALDEGRARGELEMATALYTEAKAGNATAALAILTHRYGWKSKADEDTNKTQEAQAMMDYAKLSDDELARLEALLAKGQQGNVVPIK